MFAATLDLPDDLAVPDEMIRAWAWMEANGELHQRDDSDGRTFLTPYTGERQLGIVFDSGATLTGWFGDEEVEARVARRVLPFAEISGDGGIGALWLDDDGATRFVALTTDGETFVLADSAVDFLRLVAVGYDELRSWTIGTDVAELDPEEDDFLLECVEALAPFRSWVEQEFGTTVPTAWSQVDPDDNGFATWINEQTAPAGA